ncbi:MAG: C1 family peptidase [Verrucomicrobiota bacterium]|nr:C1 family peptidase [Verrucomicrobiota bacterium]
MVWYRLLVIVFLWAGAVAVHAAGETFDKLELNGVVYIKVRVTEVTPESVTLFHQKGVTKLMLEQLSPEWQQHFHYDPAAAAAYREKRLSSPSAAPKSPSSKPASASGARGAVAKPQATRAKDMSTGSQLMGTLLMKFGTPPEMVKDVDMRARFGELDLVVKNQGRRPSCAIFAVISALEFQNAQAAGKAEALSEEYLIWATRKSLGLTAMTQSAEDEELDEDAGFTLIEVVQALRAFGVPLREQMPNSFGKSMAAIAEPSTELIAEARNRRTVAATLVTGRDNETKIDNIIHTLNTNTPVVAGVLWPPSRAIAKVALLSQQEPRVGYAHAITLIGYQCKTGRKEDVVFIFKNSWGRRWGSGGYGFATYEYLQNNLQDAVILEVSPPS